MDVYNTLIGNKVNSAYFIQISYFPAGNDNNSNPLLKSGQ